MAKWSWREHRTEKATSTLLLINTAIAVSYWILRWEALALALVVLTVLAFLVHLLARFYHRLEKYSYNRSKQGRR